MTSYAIYALPLALLKFHYAGLSGDPFLANDQDDDNFRRAETPSDVMGGVGMSQGRIAHARYSFEAAAEGELQISEGTSLEILDDHDPNWWYARDVGTGREGVVPKSYVI